MSLMPTSVAMGESPWVGLLGKAHPLRMGPDRGRPAGPMSLLTGWGRTTDWVHQCIRRRMCASFTDAPALGALRAGPFPYLRRRACWPAERPVGRGAPPAAV